MLKSLYCLFTLSLFTNPTGGFHTGDFATDDFVFVQGGTFIMGYIPELDSIFNSDKASIRKVTLSDFYIGKFEVTQKQWRDVMGFNPSRFGNCDNCPVETVSWNDVQDFLKKLNAVTPGINYRLPTEAEWEYAARGGSLTKGYIYAGSNTIDEVGWYAHISGNKTHPVGGKKPNELGIYDMSGNVWEWCSDKYGTHYSAETNQIGHGSGYRVCRGGSWDYIEQSCRITMRDDSSPSHRYPYVGFRLCLSR